MITKKILLLSDTHSYLSESVLHHAEFCDEIWHAGDIGNIDIINQLKSLKHLKAVFGNIDDMNMRQLFSEDLVFEYENIKILMTHIGGGPEKLTSRAKKLIRLHNPDVFICGHSHIVRIKHLPEFNNCIYLNPGACGNEGFHTIKTFMILEFAARKLGSIKIVEIGKRGLSHR